jgi:hypothetical protein
MLRRFADPGAVRADARHADVLHQAIDGALPLLLDVPENVPE